MNIVTYVGYVCMYECMYIQCMCVYVSMFMYAYVCMAGRQVGSETSFCTVLRLC